MMHAGYWFLILLILNTLTALLYLIWYLVFKQDKITEFSISCIQS